MKIAPIYLVISPSEWQPAPEWMNLHYLLRAERCPRSAALRYSRYAELWDKNGYPDKPTAAALAGTVVHASVARIVRKFAENGCASIDDPRCFTVLKQLGGYTHVLGNVIDRLMESLSGNPRFDLVRDAAFANLTNRIPTLREQVQLQLSKLVWVPTIDGPINANAEVQKSNSSPSVRSPLPQGVHFEVEVRDPSLKWRGIIDYIDIAEMECTIKDFKTGVQSDDHLLQVQLYALLWLHDCELNPSALPASKLSLCYPTTEKQIAISAENLRQLSQSLATRTQNVRASVTGNASKANLNAENCPHCDVRHLCNEYWSSSRAIAAVPESSTIPLDDVELVLKTRKSEETWLCECRVSNHFKNKSSVLLRWSAPSFTLLENLKPETRVRFAGAIVTNGLDAEIPVVTCIPSTDLLLVKTPSTDQM